MDVHKKDSQLCILSEDRERLEHRIRTGADRFRDLLGSRPRARILIESSTESVTSDQQRAGHFLMTRSLTELT